MGSYFTKLVGEEAPQMEQRKFSDLMTPVKRLRYLVDPRSATKGIERSPIVVQEEPVFQQTPVKIKHESKTLLAPIEKSDVALDVEDEIDEAIIIFQDMDIEQPQLIDIQQPNLVDVEVPHLLDIEPPQLIEPQVEEPTELPEAPKLTETPILKKKSRRPPLGKICTNSPIKDTTPREDKTWMNFKEERIRRGIEDVENTPPFLSKAPDQIQSAPGKFTRRQPLTFVPTMVFED